MIVFYKEFKVWILGIFCLLMFIPIACNGQILSWFDTDASTTAHYLFEQDGTDETGNYDLTIQGTPTYSIGSKGKYVTTGQNADRFYYQTLPNHSSTGSLEAIVKRDISTSGNYDVFLHFAANNRLYLRYSGSTGAVTISIGDLSGSVTTALIANDGDYHYLAMTWHSTVGVDTTVDVWLDGVKHGDAIAYTGGVNLSAFSFMVASTSSLTQSVDEIRLSTVERSDAEIAIVQAKFAASWAVGSGFGRYGLYTGFGKW